MSQHSKERTPGSDIIFYQSEDGRTGIEVRVQDKTVWLTQKLMADLFQVTVPTVNEHIRNIYAESELQLEPTIRKFRIVQTEGPREVTREVDCYNLDVIISVGYRVKSHRGTQFRIWATQRLREYLVKGFAMDDERLKKGSGDYFDELLARIRDIRSSEKVFWRKVLDIYATSMDYDPDVAMTQKFFQTVQNKMHWAAHGHTAAEVVHGRADADKPNMGLTSWIGAAPRRDEVEIAKNYLTAAELDALNRIVSAYLEFAELQALSRTPMYMADWIAKLDDFLKLSGRQLLDHAGSVSHEKALEKARAEYEKYHAAHLKDPSPVEQHFMEAAKQIEAKTKKRLTGKRTKIGGKK